MLTNTLLKDLRLADIVAYGVGRYLGWSSHCVERPMSKRGFFASFCTYRAFAVASMLLGSAPVTASACARGTPLDLFFDRVPEDSSDFIVLEVTLVNVSPSGDFFGVARIDRVLNGHVDGERLKLFRIVNPCEMYLSGQRHGIVLGAFRNNSTDELVVVTQGQWNAGARFRDLRRGLQWQRDGK